PPPSSTTAPSPSPTPNATWPPPASRCASTLSPADGPRLLWGPTTPTAAATGKAHHGARIAHHGPPPFPQAGRAPSPSLNVRRCRAAVQQPWGVVQGLAMKPSILIATRILSRLHGRLGEHYTLHALEHPEPQAIPAAAQDAQALITAGGIRTDAAL